MFGHSVTNEARQQQRRQTSASPLPGGFLTGHGTPAFSLYPFLYEPYSGIGKDSSLPFNHGVSIASHGTSNISQSVFRDRPSGLPVNLPLVGH